MIIRATILLALVTGASADCFCDYQNQTYGEMGTPNFFVQGGFDEHSNACPVTCSYYLYSGDSSKGVGKYAKVQWSPDADRSTIVFSNINNDQSVTPIITINQSTPDLPSLASSTPYVRVDVSTTGATSILVTFTQVSFSTSPPVVPTTSIPTTTVPYIGDLTGNPAAISNDLLIMVDGGKNLYNNNVFVEMRGLAANIIDKIATGIIVGNASDVGVAKTRLALNSMTPINSGALLQAWHSDATDVSLQIRSLPQIQTLATNYTAALTPLTLTDSPFSINNSLEMAFQNSRLNAQRILLVVSNAVPADLSTLQNVRFIDNDIHPIYLAYKLDSTSFHTVTNGLKNTPWSFYNPQDNSEDTVTTFVNKFLLSGNTVCASTIKFSADPITPTSIAANLSIPASYSLVTDPTSSWLPSPQKNRYCNWQTQKIKFLGLDGSKTTCFTVYYELESGKDRVRFIPADENWNSNGTDLVTLSGLDVSGSTIRTTGNILVQFETNESDVRGGFYLQYKAC